MGKKFSNEEIEKCIPFIRQIIDFAETARCEGVLALEYKAAQPEVDPLLTIGVNLIVDGTDPQLISSILNTILETEQYEGYELLKYKIISEGLYSIQAGENPRIIKIKLFSFLGLEYVQKAFTENEIENNKYNYKLNAQKSYTESEAFENLINTLNDNRAIQLILREVDCNQIAWALKTCGYQTTNRIHENLSKRMSGMVIDAMLSTQIDLGESIRAQNGLIAIYKKLVEKGEIIL